MTKKGTRNITRKFSNLPDVALNSPIKKENLPLPFVHYPNHYGTFMSFSEDENGQDYFCKCSESAILNYLELTNSINWAKGLKWSLNSSIVLAVETLTTS